MDRRGRRPATVHRGGVALIQAGAGLFEGLGLDGDEATGANIVKVALEAPLKQIAVNAGLEGGVVAEVRGLTRARASTPLQAL